MFRGCRCESVEAAAVIPMWLAAPTHMERDDPSRLLPKWHPCASVELPRLRGSPGIVMFKHVNNISALPSNPGNACYILRNMHRMAQIDPPHHAASGHHTTTPRGAGSPCRSP
jgi:hypothetical protein